MKSFASFKNKGFHLIFPNGVTLSTQFGNYNYCEHSVNYSKQPNYDHEAPIKAGFWESNDAEIAIWKNGTETWLTKECPFCGNEECVDGYVDMKKWLKILKWCVEHEG